MTITLEAVCAALARAGLPHTDQAMHGYASLRALAAALEADPFRVQGRLGVAPAALQLALELAGFLSVRLATPGRPDPDWPPDTRADVCAGRYERLPGTRLSHYVGYAFGLDDGEGEVLFVDVAPPGSKVTVEIVPDDYQAILDQVRNLGGQARISVHEDAQGYAVVVLWPLDGRNQGG